MAINKQMKRQQHMMMAAYLYLVRVQHRAVVEEMTPTQHWETVIRNTLRDNGSSERAINQMLKLIGEWELEAIKGSIIYSGNPKFPVRSPIMKPNDAYFFQSAMPHIGFYDGKTEYSKNQLIALQMTASYAGKCINKLLGWYYV